MSIGHFLIPVHAQGREVIIADLDGVISPPMATYITRVIEDANKSRAAAIILRTDTPGGLDSAMRDIVQSILDSDVPVIVYVVPGGRATSAGAFIAMAAHITAMAPTTVIGAASPVDIGGEDIEGILQTKVMNDSAEYIRGLAKFRGRNHEWASDKAVRAAESLDSLEALKQNVIDLVSPDVDQLIKDLDGRRVKIDDSLYVELRLSGYTTEVNKMNFVELVLFVISDPNLSVLLLSLGSLGLFFEFANPGSIFPGVVGALCILIGLYGVGTLGANWVGLILMGLGFGLFVAELVTSSFGILGAGAIVSFILGTFMLWGQSDVSVAVNKWGIGAIAGIVTVIFTLFIQITWRAQRRANELIRKSGTAALIGKVGIVKQKFDPNGIVLLHGERWIASLTVKSRDVLEGDEVKVDSVDGIVLKVAPIDRDSG